MWSAMDEHIQAFLQYLKKEKKYSSNTLAAYHNDLAQLVAYIQSKSSEGTPGSREIKLDSRILSGYLQSLREKKYAQSTMARKIAAAKSFIKYLVDTGKMRSDIAPSLASPQVQKKIPRSLSVSDVKRFLAEPAKQPTMEAQRDRAMFELLYATGLRASELMALNVDDVDHRSNRIRCRATNNKVRYVPIDNRVGQIVSDYINDSRLKLLSNPGEISLFLNRRGERLTRQGFWQIIQGYADKLGLGHKITPRSLRHSFTAHKLKSGTDLNSVKELLGHTHISTTKIYKDMGTY
jgi:integrase/recombinase XerD